MKNTEWWKTGVIYQIYPRSYYDTNGDGIGDLQGIIEKLPYLKELGVDAVWINPFFRSPMADFGYDISDYYSVDPLFGTNFNALKLIRKAHEYGIKIIFDLVLNHCSADHPWFIESRSSLDNPKRDWFTWKKEIPNNWDSIFGGRSWTKCELTNEYYYHFYLPQQPDFNLRNPLVANEIKNIMRYYLDIGVDGFRLDAINTFFEDDQLRDNPVIEVCDDKKCEFIKQRQYDFDQEETFDFLHDLKHLCDEYDDRFLLGETSDIGIDKTTWRRYLGDGKKGLDLAFNFELLYDNLDHDRLMRAIHKWNEVPEDKWPNYPMGSHDQIRYPSRLGVPEDEAQDKLRQLVLFQMTIKGTPFIYYGDELGLPEYDIPKELVKDPWPLRTNFENPTRDGCRTPMIWEQAPQGGFSSNHNTWLPIHDHLEVFSVEAQQHDSESTLNWYKKLIHIRKAHPCLQSGEQELDTSIDKVIQYTRSLDGKHMKIILNMSDTDFSIPGDISQENIICQNGYSSEHHSLQKHGCILYEI